MLVLLRYMTTTQHSQAIIAIPPSTPWSPSNPILVTWAKIAPVISPQPSNAPVATLEGISSRTQAINSSTPIVEIDFFANIYKVNGEDVWPGDWKSKFTSGGSKMAFITDPDGYEVEILENKGEFT